ncbi:MAG: hypothetical protein ABFS32_23025 [Bacteroidota bacterium]
MKKKMFISFVVLIALLLTTSIVFADEFVDDVPKDSHKIRTKWNLQGSFLSQRDPEFVGQNWIYNIQIKEAMDGEYSKGVIEFTSADSVITAHVEATKTNYLYWSGYPALENNIASVGWAEYKGEVYNFMSIYSEGWIWIILSHDDYADEWASGGVFQGAERIYQLLAIGGHYAIDTYEWDPHYIHD